MTVRSNQSRGCFSANRVTSVGLRPRIDRPPHQDHRLWLARVVCRREQRGGGQHRNRRLAYRHHVDTRPQQANKTHHDIDEVVEIEPAIKERDIARIHPIGEVDVVVAQHGLDGAAQQGREVARQRGDDQHCRLVAAFFLAEVQQVAKRMRGHDLLGDADLCIIERDAADPEIGPVVRQAGVGQQLHRRRRASHERKILDQRPWLGQNAAQEFRHKTDWGEHIALCLIGVVKHISSSDTAPELANLQTVDTVPVSIDRKASDPNSKCSMFQGYIWLDNSLRKSAAPRPRGALNQLTARSGMRSGGG